MSSRAGEAMESQPPEEVGDLDPTRPIETDEQGRLVYFLYDQAGKLTRMTCQDTPHYRRFVVWLRKFDRYGPHEKGRDMTHPNPSSAPEGVIPEARLREIIDEYADLAADVAASAATGAGLPDGPGAASAFYGSLSLAEVASMGREILALRSALSAIVPAPVRDGWRTDMENAPRDGTAVLLWSGMWEMSWGIQIGYFEGDGEGGGQWVTAEGIAEDNDPGYDPNAEVDIDTFDADDDSNMGPTHWQPLPASPGDNT